MTNADDPAERIFTDTLTFGKDRGYYRFTDRSTGIMNQTFRCFRGNEDGLCLFKLMIPGEFNVYNATAAIALTHEMGFQLNPSKPLESYRSVDRRFTFRGLDDFRNLSSSMIMLHTPDEISNTIRGAREFFPGKNVIVVFQPHRYSRLVRERPFR